MSDPVKIAIVQGVATAIPILFVQWLNHRKVSKEMNGMKTALIEGAEREGLAIGKIEGHADGVKDQKIAQAEKLNPPL